ncbi:MAG TPA: TraR/DksA family transcriptional regulator [Steroidobacteraceae bacterium]|nr:TraR/DksA family transcriptional regulator [Steroidobacteraceae bacterium]
MHSTLSSADHHRLEKSLRERKELLRSEIRDTLLRIDAERYAIIAGQVQDTQDQSLADLLADVGHADVARDVEEVRDIEVALQRLAAGGYGQCIQCGAAIPLARLEAFPTAKRCLPCQQRYESARVREALLPTP